MKISFTIPLLLPIHNSLILSCLFFLVSCAILFDPTAQLPHLIFTSAENGSTEVVLGKHKELFSLYDLLRFSECKEENFEPLLGYIDARLSKAAIAYLAVSFSSCTLCITFLASSFAAMKIEKLALYTISSLFSLVCILYLVLISGKTSTACYTASGSLHTSMSSTRVFQPIMYCFWLSSITLSSVSLSRHSSTRAKLYGSLYASVMVFSGLATTLSHSVPALHLVFLLSGSIALALHTKFLATSLLQVLQHGINMSFLCRFVIVPLILLINVILPLVWLFAQFSFLTVSTESNVLTALNFLQVFLVSGLIISIELDTIIGKQESDLRESNAKREEAEEQRSSVRGFMRYSFHELRVPLNTMSLGIDEVRASLNDTYCSLNKDGDARTKSEIESAIASLEVIGLSTSVMSKLLDDFLSLEKIEAGKLKLEMTTFPIENLLHASLSSFVLAAENRNVQLFLSVDDRVPKLLTSDMLKLQQVLSNFLSNALKFVQKGGTVILHVEPEVRNFQEITPEASVNLSTINMDGLRNRKQLTPQRASDLTTASAEGILILDKNALDDIYTLLARTQNVEKIHFPRAKGFDSIQILPKKQGEKGETYCEKSLRESGSGIPPSSSWIRFSVVDNGPGISPQDQMKLFKPFQQVSAGSTSKGSGTGLGLSIAARIVRLNAGRIGVSSIEGIGSNFWVSLPVSFPNIVHTPHLADPASFIPLFNPKQDLPSKKAPTQLDCAVVCDDVASNRLFFGKLLLRRGVKEVLYAEDGVELLSLFEKDDVRARVQVVFLDNEMPKMNGEECVRLCRQRKIDCPIIGVTGSALDADKISFLSAGCNAVLIKPVHFALLTDALSDAGLLLKINSSLDGLHEETTGVRFKLQKLSNKMSEN